MRRGSRAASTDAQNTIICCYSNSAHDSLSKYSITRKRFPPPLRDSHMYARDERVLRFRQFHPDKCKTSAHVGHKTPAVRGARVVFVLKVWGGRVKRKLVRTLVSFRALRIARHGTRSAIHSRRARACGLRQRSHGVCVCVAHPQPELENRFVRPRTSIL